MTTRPVILIGDRVERGLTDAEVSARAPGYAALWVRQLGGAVGGAARRGMAVAATVDWLCAWWRERDTMDRMREIVEGDLDT